MLKYGSKLLTTLRADSPQFPLNVDLVHRDLSSVLHQWTLQCRVSKLRQAGRAVTPNTLESTWTMSGTLGHDLNQYLLRIRSYFYRIEILLLILSKKTTTLFMTFYLHSKLRIQFFLQKPYLKHYFITRKMFAGLRIRMTQKDRIRIRNTVCLDLSLSLSRPR